MTRISLNAFETEFNPPDSFEVSFTEMSFPAGKSVRLATFQLQKGLGLNLGADQARTSTPFIVTAEAPDALVASLELPANDESGEIGRSIHKYLADTFMRTGLLQPRIDISNLSELIERQQLVLLVDTNILNLGVIDYIIDCRKPEQPLLAIIPVTCVLELQKYSDEIRPPRSGALNIGRVRALIGRSLGISTLHHIQHLKQRCIVEFVEVDPTTLQFFYLEAAGQRGGTKADRIIIESFKQILANRRFSENPIVLTADINVAKFLQVENIDAIYVRQPILSESLFSVTYNLFSQTYYAAKLAYVVWMLAEAFGDIKVAAIGTDSSKEEVFRIRDLGEFRSLEHWLERQMDIAYEMPVAS